MNRYLQRRLEIKQLLAAAETRREIEWEQKLVGARTDGTGTPISDSERIELLVDIKQLGSYRVPDETQIVERLVGAPTSDPALPELCRALLERCFSVYDEDSLFSETDREIHKSLTAFRLRPHLAEHLVTGSRIMSGAVHVCERPANARFGRWRRTLCGQKARKFERAERGDWADADYRRCQGCERQQARWERILECGETRREIDYDYGHATLVAEAVEIATPILLEMLVECRAGGYREAEHRSSDWRKLTPAQDAAASGYWQAARRLVMRRLVTRGDGPLIAAVQESTHWQRQIPELQKQLPIGVHRFVDLLDDDVTVSTPHEFWSAVSRILVEEELRAEGIAEERRLQAQLEAEADEAERLRGELRNPSG